VITVLVGGLAISTAAAPKLAAWYVGGALATFALFRAAAWAVVHGLRRLPRLRRPLLRLALDNLHRPGAPTTSAVLSLGLGLTVLVATALLEHNLGRQIAQVLPREAPGYYFIDIQPGQAADFDAVIAAEPGVEAMQRVPILRGRITKLAGIRVEKLTPPPDFAWILQGDRGLTWARRPPDAGSRIVGGEWWPSDYTGPPLVSFDAKAARGFGLHVGDTITVNVLGREVTARVANLRQIEWTSLGINFVMVFSPGMLAGAPQTEIATVRVAPERELALERAVARALPNVSAIRVKDVLRDVSAILASLAVAVRGVAAVAITAGMLVLGGSLAVDHHRRIYDAVVLKVLGATRGKLLLAYLLEVGLLALVTTGVAVAIGGIAAWAVVAQVMDMTWHFAITPVLWTLLLAVTITALLGFTGTWRALSRKPAPVLRND